MSRALILAGLVPLLLGSPALAHPGHDAWSQPLADQSLSSGLSLTGLVVAFLFGSAHALAPGHGKTMVAAYLVGSRGTPSQALLLGIITTITHTIGVFALGLITLFASKYILPEQLYPILSLVSGFTVIGVGFWLLDQRLNWARHAHNHGHSHSHAHTHSHQSDPAHTSEHAHSVGHQHHTHHPSLPEVVSLRSLVALGIAGGIVPCPSALVLLLSAIALHQTGYGILLVSIFSLGLASILIAIGLSVVYARQQIAQTHWVKQLPISKQFTQALPIASAVIVILVGAGLCFYSVV